MSMVCHKSTIMSLMNHLLKITDKIFSVPGEEFFGQKYIVHQAILDITSMLFPGNHILAIYNWEPSSGSKEAFFVEFTKWYGFMYAIVESLDDAKNAVEADFYLLICYLEIAEIEEIQMLMKMNLEGLKEEKKELYKRIVRSYHVFKDYWGDLNPEEGIYDLIAQRASALKEYIREWEWLYENLYDIRSKKVLYNILMNWLTFDIKWLNASIENVFGDYFDLDLIPETTQEEVFVDLGGYTGDTIRDFVSCYSGRYKRLYTYEINEENYSKLIENSKEYHDIVPRKAAAGEKAGKMFVNIGLDSSCTTVAETGDKEIAVVTLDDDIKEEITWIKMDIEGAEQAALRGSRKHIKNEKPKLTICTYHNNEDIWKIPKMIKEYREDYKLYLRYNGQSVWPSEYVLFAL